MSTQLNILSDVYKLISNIFSGIIIISFIPDPNEITSNVNYDNCGFYSYKAWKCTMRGPLYKEQNTPQKPFYKPLSLITLITIDKNINILTKKMGTNELNFASDNLL